MADGHADQEQSEGELGHAVGNAEFALQAGHRGHEDIERQGADGADGDENEEGGAGGRGGNIHRGLIAVPAARRKARPIDRTIMAGHRLRA
jgi:hypothetical protein